MDSVAFGMDGLSVIYRLNFVLADGSTTVGSHLPVCVHSVSINCMSARWVSVRVGVGSMLTAKNVGVLPCFYCWTSCCVFCPRALKIGQHPPKLPCGGTGLSTGAIGLCD